MKYRTYTRLLALALSLTLLTACGGNDKDTNQDNNGQNTVGEDIQNAGEDIMDAGEDYDSHTLKSIMHHNPTKDYMLEYEECRKAYLVPLEEMEA